ncbi:MAG: hypothetical protein R6V05_15055 [Candidatus Brocadiia bacterium]
MTWRTIAVAVAVVLVFGMALGCETMAGPSAAQEEEVVLCPLCGEDTRTVAVEDLEYEKLCCPKCRTVRREVWDGFYALHSEVQVCDQCGVIVEDCAECCLEAPGS